METYHRETYAAVHHRGRKRITTSAWRPWPGRSGRGPAAQPRALLGLYHWWPTASGLVCMPATSRKSAGKAPSPSLFPRLRHAPERFQVQHLPSDRELVQLMLALRLFLPEVGFTSQPGKAPASGTD